jgi:hypothetical protein
MKIKAKLSRRTAAHGNRETLSEPASNFLEEQQVVKIFNDPLMLTS